ncbi:MAG: methionyl-tRNA formyltransferase [Pegethrix bostrychoides GSE-TBD4-15B]|jgi:methionyl-tRNA formyltransferase|uniref:Methionyl-tRNA formyltransferase n=1 Tax=Pegethrix bostrychoides GSE-TBD4-15B TaxID=2839662 RepID=A0A951U393_9CYAN|nr:methionyl-tRNA formyltransferase [Pegethrix bostrychoides GSE-TBD4-15B]
MKLIFFGTPQFAVPSLESLMAQPDFELLAVVTQPDKRRGRGSELSASPIKSQALAQRLPVLQPRRIKKEPEILEQLRQMQADAFVVVAYGQILSPEILAMPRLGCINGHGSILPKYRGAAPIQWCLYHGETITGVTTMQMDAGMDTGAMLLKAITPISLLDNAPDLAGRLSQITADLLIETLLGLEAGRLTPIPQAESAATYAPLIQKADYQLDWARPALALHNQIRGFYPNCSTSLRGLLLKVTATLPLNPAALLALPDGGAALLEQMPQLQELQAEQPELAESGQFQPGQVVSLLKNQGAVIQTGDGLLLLREVQLAGKRTQSGWDFANGTRLQLGERLGEYGEYLEPSS